MKRKIAKIAALALAFALAVATLCLLAACNDGSAPSGSGGSGGGSGSSGSSGSSGGSGTTVTYTYDDVDYKITYNGQDMSQSGQMSNIKQTYDALYAGSTLSVNQSQIVLETSGVKNVMQVTMNGGKYELSGDYCEQMRNALFGSSQPGYTVESSWFDMYGEKTSAGFNVVMNYGANINASGYQLNSVQLITLKFV